MGCESGGSYWYLVYKAMIAAKHPTMYRAVTLLLPHPLSQELPGPKF